MPLTTGCEYCVCPSYETPMTPITAMRNSLGREEGGSGAPLDREAYLKAVAYWDTHAAVQ